MSIGYPAAAYADDFTDEATAHSDADDEIETTSALTREDNDIGPDVALLTGAATAAPYLTAPAFFLANAAVGLVTDIFLDDNADEPEFDPAAQVAAKDDVVQ